MIRMTEPDCAVMCNLINIHSYKHVYIHTYIHDRAGLRGYVQFNKYIHTYIHTYSIIDPPSGGSMRVA